MKTRWGLFILSWLVIFYLPWWWWLVLVLILALKFSYFWEPIVPALWYDILFGLPVTGRFGQQFIMTIGVLLIVWSVEQIKKALIFYH